MLPQHPWFRFWFVAAHFVIPAAAVWLGFKHLFCCVEISWEVLVLFGVALLPFLLPLLCVYIVKAGTFETADPTGKSEFAPTPPEAPEPHAEAQPPQPPPIQLEAAPAPPTLPEIGALLSEELKVVRTLWKYQHDYEVNRTQGKWGFTVGEGAADYRDFVRGFSYLARRALVLQNPNGLVFLTDWGIEFCRKNSIALLAAGPAWTNFQPIPTSR